MRSKKEWILTLWLLLAHTSGWEKDGRKTISVGIRVSGIIVAGRSHKRRNSALSLCRSFSICIYLCLSWVICFMWSNRAIYVVSPQIALEMHFWGIPRSFDFPCGMPMWRRSRRIAVIIIICELFAVFGVLSIGHVLPLSHSSNACSSSGGSRSMRTEE